jgi:hypothetical protein
MERALCEFCQQHHTKYRCDECQRPICRDCLGVPGYKSRPGEGSIIGGAILCPDHVEDYLRQGRGNSDEAWGEDERSHRGRIEDEEEFDEEEFDEEFDEEEETSTRTSM